MPRSITKTTTRCLLYFAYGANLSPKTLERRQVKPRRILVCTSGVIRFKWPSVRTLYSKIKTDKVFALPSNRLLISSRFRACRVLLFLKSTSSFSTIAVVSGTSSSTHEKQQEQRQFQKNMPLKKPPANVLTRSTGWCMIWVTRTGKSWRGQKEDTARQMLKWLCTVMTKLSLQAPLFQTGARLLSVIQIRSIQRRGISDWSKKGRKFTSWTRSTKSGSRIFKRFLKWTWVYPFFSSSSSSSSSV